ncbi:MAG: hypothetical protein K2N06_06650 [Oscillospiraceae bacterium]|nr:hypothetical protein [Oscillospiraceae bacterium]
MKNKKTFLSSALILSAALVLLCVFMPDWNPGSIVAVVLVAILCAFQWALFLWARKQ